MQTYVMIVGDIMLDEYIYGSSHRLSPEAPVPIIRWRETECRLGGAGNVAANVKSLMGQPMLMGVVGDDRYAQFVYDALSARGIAKANVHRDDRKTTVKTRLIGNGYQIARLDQEDSDGVDHLMENLIVKDIENWMHLARAVIVSDYAKGVITPKIMATIYRKALEFRVPVFIDPRVDHVDLYAYNNPKPFTIITPNTAEAEGLSGSKIQFDWDVETAGHAIMQSLDISAVVITRGEHGMSVISKDTCVHVPTEAQNVFDVSGAGDTVIATLAVMVGGGAPLEQAARWANRAAGIVVGKKGTAVCSIEELQEANMNALDAGRGR